MDTTSEKSQNSLSFLLKDIKTVQTDIQRATSRLVRSEREISSAKVLAQIYFRNTRNAIIKSELDPSELDSAFAELIELTNKHSQRSSYLSVLKKAQKKAVELEIQTEYTYSAEVSSAGSELGGFTRQESSIVEKLKEINPFFADAYIQIILDIRDEKRISFRGVVHEIRELVRGLLNHFAPNEQVMGQVDFQFENRLDKPSMTQKMKYVLNARGLSGSQIDPAKKMTSYLEVQTGILAAMPRSTYSAGSDTAHADSRDVRNEVLRLKRYLDTNICDILQID